MNEVFALRGPRMKSSPSFLSSPPSPHPAPLPLPSSPLTHCAELDLSITLSPTPAHPKKKAQVCLKKPLVVTVTPEPCMPLSTDALPQRPINSQRRRGRLHGGASNQRVEPPAFNEPPGILEGAGLNSTLALKAELQALQGAEFNSQKLVQETLRKSERTKHLLNSRVTEGVNVSRSQLLFTSLVSVDVQEDQLISQVHQDRLLLAPPPRSLDNKSTDSPSPLPFMTSDLLRQKPLPVEEQPVCNKPQPLPCPAPSTFDLYRRQRRWEATP
ncbi:protein phosphatase 1 regulatory subunit 35 [Aulostomus maculatus]